MRLLKALWKLVITPPPVYAMVLSNLLFFSVIPVHGHQANYSKCFQGSKAMKVGADRVVDSNGLLLEEYDTNGDGKPDLATLSHIEGNGHKKHPLFYIVDRDFDDVPDFIYIDKKGDGRCRDIVLYEDLTIPHDTGLNFKEQTQTQKGRAI